MAKFYFTYGTNKDFPFRDGWTEVTAPNYKAAYTLFRMIHPDITEGILNCSDIYTEEQFLNSEMYQTNKNFRHGCYEKITLNVERTEE